MIRTTTSTAPAHWASYVVYGDASGIDDSDIAACDAWLLRQAVDGWQVVDVDMENASFAHTNDARTLACNVAEYTLYRVEV
jgi:hypothetical protein